MFTAAFRPAARVRLLACLLIAGAAIAPSQAQVGQSEADKLAALFNTGMQAFTAGRWNDAATGFEAFLRAVPDQKSTQLQGAYYQLGAAYFNAPNYPKAVETFKKYLEYYPQGEKAGEVKWDVAQCMLFDKKYDEASKLFTALESSPQYRELAMAAEVRCYKALKKPEKIIPILERLIAPEIKTTTQASAGIELATYYAESNKPDKAVALLTQLQAKSAIVDNLVSLNSVAIKLGDLFADKKNYPEAIGAYRAVRPREEVIKLQHERLQLMDRRMEVNLKSAVNNAPALAQAQMLNQQIKTIQTEQKDLLDAFEKLPDYTAPLLFRQGKCWYEWDKKWECIVVYDRIVKRYPTAIEREPSIYSMVVAYSDLNQAKRCQEICQQYLKEFPEGPNAGTVGYLSGAVALQVGDFAGAESFFGIMLEKVPKSEYKETMRYLLGNAQFSQGKYAEAVKNYEQYLAEFPNGDSVEEVSYRIAVVKVFDGEYEAALAALTAYLQKYPKGSYIADARYRVAVCKYAASQYDEVVSDCESWIRDFPKDDIQGEVDALLGDALAAQNKHAEAAAIYERSYKAAKTDEVLNYSLFEASKQLQKLNDWPGVARFFEEFVRLKPDHTAVVAAMFWIGKARARQGETEEAKAVMVENLKKYIAEPKREAVEQLLTQLALLCSKRPKAAPRLASDPAPLPPPVPVTPAEVQAGGSVAPNSTPAAPPPPPPYDAMAELDKQLAPLEKDANGTARARLLFGRAEMAVALKKPQEAERIYREIADRFKIDDLSPPLLATVGDYLFSKGDIARAEACYAKLKEDYPKSDYLDSAYVGLGEVAFSKKDYAGALQLFTDALDKVAAAMKTKEATLGKAKTLLELKRYDESKKLFEQVAGVREWRGDATAYAVYSLGEIEARQNKWAEAIAHYRRVFVAYQKYLPWVARSYLRAAESFVQMGKRQDAVDNLKEMLRNEKLEKQPEYEEARKRLREMGEQA